MTPEYLHFTSREDFDRWHTKVKQELGLPRIGVNAATGKPAPEKQKTTAYAEPEEHPDGKKGHICRIDVVCPEKMRNKDAEKEHKFSHKAAVVLKKEGWFKDRTKLTESPKRKSTTETKA